MKDRMFLIILIGILTSAISFAYQYGNVDKLIFIILSVSPFLIITIKKVFFTYYPYEKSKNS